ncbi:MAG: hypothetical protein R3A45_11365, partial [Bdellovibrionota bacterium]
IPNYLSADPNHADGKVTTSGSGNFISNPMLYEYAKKKLQMQFFQEASAFVAGKYQIWGITTYDSYSNSSYIDGEMISRLNQGKWFVDIQGTMPLDEAKAALNKGYSDDYKSFPLDEYVDVLAYEETSPDDFSFTNQHSMNQQFQSVSRNKNIIKVLVDKKHSKYLKSISLKFQNSNDCTSNEMLEYSIGNWGDAEFESKINDEQISFFIYVDPEQYGCQSYDLKKITYGFSRGDEPGYFSPSIIEVSFDEPNAILKRQPDLELYKPTPVEIDVDGIKFKLIEDPNRPYHYKPEIKLPASGLDGEELKFRIKIECIEGAGAGRYNNEFNINQEVNPGKPEGSNTTIEIDESQYKKLEEGKYISESIEVEPAMGSGMNALRRSGVSMPKPRKIQLDLERKKIREEVVL